MNCFFFFQAEDGIRDKLVTGVQTCALPISRRPTGRTPRCRASPFRTAPIPCSRTPKWILRAPQLPAATSPPFLKARFVEVARSADPPTSSGSLGARAFSTFPDAARVAWASAGGGGNGGGPPAPPAPPPAGRRRPRSAAR